MFEHHLHGRQASGQVRWTEREREREREREIYVQNKLQQEILQINTMAGGKNWRFSTEIAVYLGNGARSMIKQINAGRPNVTSNKTVKKIKNDRKMK